MPILTVTRIWNIWETGDKNATIYLLINSWICKVIDSWFFYCCWIMCFKPILITYSFLNWHYDCVNCCMIFAVFWVETHNNIVVFDFMNWYDVSISDFSNLKLQIKSILQIDWLSWTTKLTMDGSIRAKAPLKSDARTSSWFNYFVIIIFTCFLFVECLLFFLKWLLHCKNKLVIAACY